MTKEQTEAVQALWDALSEYVEEPSGDVPVIGSIREMGCAAIDLARIAFPEMKL